MPRSTIQPNTNKTAQPIIWNQNEYKANIWHSTNIYNYSHDIYGKSITDNWNSTLFEKKTYRNQYANVVRL